MNSKYEKVRNMRIQNMKKYNKVIMERIQNMKKSEI
jgi:hypothetical protein